MNYESVYSHHKKDTKQKLMEEKQTKSNMRIKFQVYWKTMNQLFYKKESGRKKTKRGRKNKTMKILNPEPVVKVYPWKIPGKEYTTFNKLSEEIEDFYGYMFPSYEEEQIRLDVIGRIKNVALKLWPKAQVEVFGSFLTELYLPSSDIDMVVLGTTEILTSMLQLKLALIHEGVTRMGMVEEIRTSKVPIIKLTDIKTSIRVDISFNQLNGLSTTNFINEKICEFPCLSKLITVLKHFLLERDLKEVFTGGLSSYGLTLLIVRLLQVHSGYDMNLGELLLEFFKLYGNFDYEEMGILVKGSGDFQLKNELRLSNRQYHRPGLCIGDPIVPRNVITCRRKLTDIKTEFMKAYMLLLDIKDGKIELPPNQSVLQQIISVNLSDDVNRWSQIVKMFPHSISPCHTNFESASSSKDVANIKTKTLKRKADYNDVNIQENDNKRIKIL